MSWVEWLESLLQWFCITHFQPAPYYLPVEKYLLWVWIPAFPCFCCTLVSSFFVLRGWGEGGGEKRGEAMNLASSHINFTFLWMWITQSPELSFSLFKAVYLTSWTAGYRQLSHIQHKRMSAIYLDLFGCVTDIQTVQSATDPEDKEGRWRGREWGRGVGGAGLYSCNTQGRGRRGGGGGKAGAPHVFHQLRLDTVSTEGGIRLPLTPKVGRVGMWSGCFV